MHVYCKDWNTPLPPPNKNHQYQVKNHINSTPLQLLLVFFIFQEFFKATYPLFSKKFWISHIEEKLNTFHHS